MVENMEYDTHSENFVSWLDRAEENIVESLEIKIDAACLQGINFYDMFNEGIKSSEVPNTIIDRVGHLL